MQVKDTSYEIDDGKITKTKTRAKKTANKQLDLEDSINTLKQMGVPVPISMMDAARSVAMPTYSGPIFDFAKVAEYLNVEIKNLQVNVSTYDNETINGFLKIPDDQWFVYVIRGGDVIQIRKENIRTIKYFKSALQN